MASRICRRLQLRIKKTWEENGTTSVLKMTNEKISFEKFNVNQNTVVLIK